MSFGLTKISTYRTRIRKDIEESVAVWLRREIGDTLIRVGLWFKGSSPVPAS